ncbi:ABC transporter substrate-binding protein [Halobacterium litoreum]|uniref:ABC transporter substrate-binding protein n=1 Tax=Halobacterium litoreum TaxID=2039234 RepID=A0ABD5NEP9_9EURY|nr:ABC transporter substrate-binding protein [Halobacterium litoreum]UHH13379.1 ABC transporter substrate-binding protein [Halobacterium litoreum]
MTDTDNLSRRRFLQGTGAAATAAALAGCTGGGGDDDEETTTSPTDDGGDNGGDNEDSETTEEMEYDPSKTLRSLNVGTMDTLDPIKATDTTSGANIQNIFDALTNYPHGQTNVEMLLAESLETANDGATLTFTLKQGATYNNGDEVTAQDFVYSFERLAASDNSRRSTFILDTLGVKHETETTTVDGEEQEVYKPGTIAVTAEDDYTLTLELEQPFYAATSMLAYTSFSAVPEGLVGDIEGYEGQMSHQEFATKNPVGAGPYTLESWEQASEVQLSARDDYHGETPMNAGIHKAVYTESNARYTYATVNVNADSPYIPSAQYKPDLREFEGTDDRGRRYGTYGPMDENGLTADYYEVATPSTYYLAFNSEVVPKPVRQAVAYVYSQKTFVEQIFPRPAKPAYHFTPPGLFPGGPSNYEEQAQDYKYGYEQRGQVAKAKEVMEAAGYGPDNQFSMSFTMPSSSASSWGSDLYTLLRDQLTQAHIKLELNSADWNTFLNSARNGNVEMYYLGWLADYPGLDNFLNLAYPPATDTSGQAIGYINWSSETGDAAEQAIDGWEMIQNNYGTGQAEARGEGGMMMENAIEEDAVYIPMIHGITQGYSYPWLESPRSGAMGGSRGKEIWAKIGDRGEFE